MGRRLSPAIAGALLLVSHSAASLAAPPITAPPLPESPEAAFRWFDGLDFPSLKQARFVLVRSRKWNEKAWSPEDRDPQHGFLLEENADTFRVFLPLAMEAQTFPKVNESHASSFKPADLASYIDERIREFDRRKPEETDELNRLLTRRRVSERAELFAIAWGASRLGLPVPAERVFDRARHTPGSSTPDSVRATRRAVAQDIAKAEMERAFDLYTNIWIPPVERRRDLLDRVERVAARFPESSHRGQAARMAEQLRRMVREDAEHLSLPLEGLSDEKKIAEWIFRLRDQTGGYSSDGEGLDVFRRGYFQQNVQASAEELASFGYAAVPQLIDAMADPRLSHCVERRPFSYRVLTIGECAEQILVRIIGRRLGLPSVTGRDLTADEITERQKRFRVWHADLVRYGERRMLIAGTEAGDADSPEQAERLIWKYKKHALPAIKVGASRIADRKLRDEFFKQLDNYCSGETEPSLLAEVEAFLLTELDSIHEASAFVGAAQAMPWRSLRPESFDAMLRRWNAASESPVRSNVRRDMALAEYLIRTFEKEGYQALTDRMHRFPVEVRMKILEKCRSIGSLQYHPGRQPGEVSPVDARVLNLLVRALDDEERHPWPWEIHQVPREYPRVCDFAGTILHSHSDGRYSYNLADTLPARDRARATIIAHWRKENGLPPLPPKQPKPPTQVTPD